MTIETLLVAIAMAVAAGLVGSLAVMRRMSLAADPLSHVALPGIGIALALHIHNRKWVFNYSNILGNLATGRTSNLYYPAADRGVILTLQRTGVVTAEGALGTVFFEFWPDISSRLFGRRQKPGVQ